MSFFETAYNDRSKKELDSLKPSEVGAIARRKERLDKWLKAIFVGAIAINQQACDKLEEELLSLRTRLVNGDESVLRRIMEVRFMIIETQKQGPFLNDEYQIIFGEKRKE